MKKQINLRPYTGTTKDVLAGFQYKYRELLSTIKRENASDKVIADAASEADVSYDNNFALNFALVMGNLNAFKIMLPLASNYSMSDALTNAVSGGHSEAIDYILNLVAPGQVTDEALAIAVNKGNIKFLLNVSFLLTSYDGEYDLVSMAASAGHVNVFKLLSNIIPPKKYSDALIAASESGSLECIKILTQHTYTDKELLNAMKVACIYDEDECLNELLSKYSVGSIPKEENYVVRAAISRTSFRCIKGLRKSGFDFSFDNGLALSMAASSQKETYMGKVKMEMCKIASPLKIFSYVYNAEGVAKNADIKMAYTCSKIAKNKEITAYITEKTGYMGEDDDAIKEDKKA